MVQFDDTRRTLPGLELHLTGVEIHPPSGRCRGAAWLSSARVVRCWVKSRNERNPYPLLLSGNAEHSRGTAGDKPEEGGDDVKSARPLCPGLHTCYNGRYNELQYREVELISKNRSQFGLQSATRLHEAESLVIVDQHATVNTFPGLVHTVRHTTRVGSARSG